MTIATIANWYATARSALRILLSGSPAPALPAPRTVPVLLPWPRVAARSTAPVLVEEPAPVLAEEPLELRCQPPESTPGFFNWMRTHEMHAVVEDRFAGLQCVICGLRWPTAPESQP
jgi:hypothetical protein